MKFKFNKVKQLPDVLVIKGEKFTDNRGHFKEVFRVDTLKEFDIGPFVQSNISLSFQGVIRGLHYQTSPAQVGKLITCVAGRIYDVAVDIRKNSKTFGQWFGKEIDGNDNTYLWIPKGFAHGFLTLSDYAYVQYHQDEYHNKECDRCIRFDDPTIDIDWDRFGFEDDLIISNKDKNAPFLKEAEWL